MSIYGEKDNYRLQKKVQVAGLDNAMQLALFIKRDCYLRI